jgi:hypothetical protein
VILPPLVFPGLCQYTFCLHKTLSFGHFYNVLIKCLSAKWFSSRIRGTFEIVIGLKRQKIISLATWRYDSLSSVNWPSDIWSKMLLELGHVLNKEGLSR